MDGGAQAFGDAGQVGDDGDQAAVIGHSLDRGDRDLQGLPVQGREPLVEEQAVQSSG